MAYDWQTGKYGYTALSGANVSYTPGVGYSNTGAGQVAGPGLGTYGPQDIYRPSTQGSVLGAQTNSFSPSTLSGLNTPGSNFGDQEAQAQDQAKIELEQAMSEYDRQAELGQQQIGSLEQEQATTLSDISTMRERTGREATTAVTEAEESTQKEKSKALSTSQDVTRQNRNILRALGILSSSAAGEMLTKPGTEYGKTAGELGTQLVKRKQQVDQWLMDRNKDFDSETTKIKNQYSNLINNIRTDLRYNGEQRALAVRAASSALQQRIAGIQQTASQYQMAAKEYNNNILSQIAQIQLYQNPNADVSGILSSMLNSGVQQPQSQTAQIYQGEQKKKNTLSGY